MKRQILLFALILLSFAGYSQTQDQLPAGWAPYGTSYFIAPDGSVWVGTAAKKFRRVAEKKALDSLAGAVNSSLALKEDKANKVGNLSTPNPTTYPTTQAVSTALSVISASVDKKLTAYPFSSYIAFGNSITAGLNATATNRRYVNLIASEIGLSPANRARGGSQAADQQDSIYRQAINNTNQLFTYMIGTNDAWIYNYDPNKRLNFKAFHAASIVYMSVADSAKMFGQSSDVAYAGTWTNSSLYGGGKVKSSFTNGSTATFSKYGDVLYIAHTVENGNGGTFTVTIDGVSKGTYTSQGEGGASITTNQGKAFGSALLRFDKLGDKVHTVVVTVTSATSSSNVVYLDWIATNKGNSKSSAPMVFVGGVPRQIPNSVGRDTATQAYTAIIKDNVLTYSGDGLNILYADVPSYINPVTDITTPSDNVHPNDLGMYHIYQAFISAINVNTRFNTKLNLLPGSNIDLTPYIKQNLNAYGTTINIGSSDANGVVVKTNNTPALSISNTQSVNIGSGNPAGVAFSINKKIDGNGGIGSYLGGNVSSTGTGNIKGFQTFIGTDAGGPGIANLSHIQISQGVFNSTVVDNFAVSVSSNFIGGTGINAAYHANIPVGTNRWNQYMAGTAYNFFQGRTLIGDPIDKGYKLQVTGDIHATMGITSLGMGSFGGVVTPGVSLSSTYPITGATTGIGVYSGGIVQSDVTTARYINTFARVAAGANVGVLSHLAISQGTFTGTVADQRGIEISSTLNSATNTNIGIYSNLNASGLKNWNFYMAGDALNRFNGYLGLQTNPTALLHLGAETATMSPFKFTIPSVQTSAPEVGTLGVAPTGDDLTYVISTGGQRKKIVLQDGSLTSGLVPVATTNGRLLNSSITTTELGYLSGLTQNIQTQLNLLPTFVQSTRTITAGFGMQGGGDFSANRTLSVDTALIRTFSNSYSKSEVNSKLAAGQTIGANTSGTAANATQWKGTNFDPSTVKSMDGSISYFIGFQGLSNSWYPVALSGLETTTNKQNSLATDGTNAKYPTVTAVNAGLSTKQNTIILKTIGTTGAATLVGDTLNVPDYSGGSGIGSSGTYTPTITNSANVSASTAFKAKYTRIGNIVTVFGRVQITTSAGSPTLFKISLPVSSAMTNTNDLSGVGQSESVTLGIYADTTAANASVNFQELSPNTGRLVYYSFSYEVL